jgi:hypothetical protein
MSVDVWVWFADYGLDGGSGVIVVEEGVDGERDVTNIYSRSGKKGI